MCRVCLCPCRLRMPDVLLLLGHKTSEAQIVHHILDFLDAILDTVRPLTKRVVLEVQDLEPGVEVLDELCNVNRTGVVALGDTVASKTGLQKSISKHVCLVL